MGVLHSVCGVGIAMAAACSVPAVTFLPTDDAQLDSRLSDSPTLDAALDAAADAAPPVRCAPGRVIHLDVTPVEPGAAIPDGRLVVVFYQFGLEVVPRPPHLVGYDQPFQGASTGVDLALGDITLPTQLDDYQLCPRTCGDLTEPACDCPEAKPKLALAWVLVVRDVNVSEIHEFTDENTYGIGHLQLGAADRAYAAPEELGFLVPGGVQDCLAPYSIEPPAAGTEFEDLGTPAANATFPLEVCVPSDSSCGSVRPPNLGRG